MDSTVGLVVGFGWSRLGSTVGWPWWLGLLREREWLRRLLAEERETFGLNESRLRDWVRVELG